MSDSVTLNGSSAALSGTGTVQSSVTAAGTNVPLMNVSAYEDEKLRRGDTQTLPKLPSHRYRYTVWHDLSSTEVKGSQLKAPRIRDGPPEKEEMFYKIRDSSNRSLHHDRRGKERKLYTDQQENWEDAKLVNLSYQELHHKYQMDNFIRVLKRLIRAEQLNLQENNLMDLSKVYFPVCVALNLNRNYITSFKKLPKIPEIIVLVLSHNDINNFDGIEALAQTGLQHLDCQHNPIAFQLNYRYKIFRALPKLVTLDGLGHVAADDLEEEDKDPFTESWCVLL